MAVELKKHGPYALVTGASVGIGEEFANQLAKKGFHLVLVARRKDKLDALAERLKKAHGVEVRVLDLDLLRPDAAEVIVDKTQDIEIGLLVLNAGIYGFGAFLKNSLEYEQSLVQLNVVLPMRLSHLFGRKMAQQRRGGIILVSSTSGFQGIPYTASYSASKAYLLALGEAVSYEVKASGVDVLVLSPGMTKTEGSDNMRGVDMSKMSTPIMAVGPVVREALDGLGEKVIVVPGLLNRLVVNLGKFVLPRSVQPAIFAKFLSNALIK